MKVAELKAILSTLPDDMSVCVLHEQTTFHTPELFLLKNTVLFVPGGITAREVAQYRPQYRHLTPSQD